jgi:hypothetical protein
MSDKPSVDSILDNIDFDDVMDDAVIDDGQEQIANTTLKLDTDNQQSTDDETKDKEELLASTEEEEKDETTSEEEADEEVSEPSFIEEIHTKLGYELDIADIDDTPEGLLDYIPKVATAIANDELNKMFTEIPDLKEYYEFRKGGGNPADYFDLVHPPSSYTDVDEVRGDDVILQESIIRDSYALQGLDEEDIVDIIKELTDKEILHSTSARLLKGLQKYEDGRAAELLKETENNKVKQEQETQKFWTDIKNTIDTKPDLDGISISTKDKGDFFNFLARPEASLNNKTRIDDAYDNLTTEERLSLDAILYLTKVKKIPLSKIIDSKAASKAAVSLRDRLKKSSVDIKSDQQMIKNNQIKDIVNDVDISAFN